MAYRIGDEPERVSPLEKFAPWLRRVLILGCLVWAIFSVENYSEDTISHTIKVSYPLLMSHEKITRLELGYDPAKAQWKPVKTGFAVADGTVLFVKVGDAVYAVKLSQQTIKPEQAAYEFLKVGTNDPVVKGIAQTFPDGVPLPGAKIGWSGKHAGSGFLYLDDAFLTGKPSRFEIGVPFQEGELKNYCKAIPAGVHFESVPWKVAGDDAQIVPTQ